MNDELTYEEEQHARRILKRYARFYGVWYVLACMLIVFVTESLGIKTGIKMLDLFLFIMIPLLGAIVMLARWTSRIFVSRLSAHERNLLLKMTPPPTYESHLNNLRAECMIDAPKELLRASAPNDEGILLRAAVYEDNTPKDELLRASNTKTQDVC